MSIEEILKKLNYISGVPPRYIEEEIEILINKIKEEQ
jgi:hypothetical protein